MPPCNERVEDGKVGGRPNLPARATRGLRRPSLDARSEGQSSHPAERIRRKDRAGTLRATSLESKGYGVFAQRNPVPKPRNDGKWVSRSAERMAVIPLLPQEPPRTTLCEPFRGPDGFCGGLSL